MSIAVMTNSTDLTNFSTANEPSASRYFMRLSEARLQDELSRCMYSLQGFDAVMRPVSAQVCQSLMTSSYWMPGSAHAHAASASLRNSSRASTVEISVPSRRERSANAVPSSIARMNSPVTRTELLPFWYWT